MITRAKQLSLGLARPPVYTRAAFVASAANTAALAAIEAWPAWPGGALALVGPEGCGKSHLATIWAERAGAVRHDPAGTVEGRPQLVEDADTIGDEALFHLINRAPTDGGLLLTARTRPASWPAALPDLRSRLNALTVAEIGAPDDALMIAVLEALFREKHIRAAPDLYAFLLRRMERSVTAARAIVTRLDQAAAEQGRPVNRTLAREVLEEVELFD